MPKVTNKKTGAVQMMDADEAAKLKASRYGKRFEFSTAKEPAEVKDLKTAQNTKEEPNKASAPAVKDSKAAAK